MQKNDMAEKKRVLIDGEERPGLVSIEPITAEKGVIEVPEFNRIRVIQNGIIKVPQFAGIYKVSRGSDTLKFLRDWFFNDEEHDVVIIRTDATGAEFARTLLPGCESIKYEEPAFDGANVTYAQVPFTLLPWDIIALDAG